MEDLFGNKIEIDTNILTHSEKIEKAIKDFQKNEKLALNMNSEEGYHISFSGGKDSIVMYDLFKKSGCKGQAYFYNTQLEIPEVPIFIRQHYPEVIFLYPKKSFMQLINEKQLLPTRKIRFCCAFLKEHYGTNSLVCSGIRASESWRRKAQNPTDFKHICMGKIGEKLMYSPILYFTEKDIFKYIKDNNLVLPNFYKTKKRSGCIGCPMSYHSQRELLEYPKLYNAMIKAIDKNFNKEKSPFENTLDMFKWWFSQKSIENYLKSKNQLNLF